MDWLFIYVCISVDIIAAIITTLYLLKNLRR
jgi:hypothetical protein